MRLEVEGQPPIENTSSAQVRSAIANLRSHGPSSFASLTDDNGNYLQVAGGGVTCMLERRDNFEGHHFRAFKKEKSKVFTDGTVLSFGGGKIMMRSDEWLTSSEVESVFLDFLNRKDFPKNIIWRDVTDLFKQT